MIVSFAMPGRDEQSALDERTDSYLAAKTSLNLSQGFSGHPVHLVFSKGQSSPSLSSQPHKPSLWFHLFENCTRRNHPSAILYPNQVKWKLHEETYPSVILQLSSGWNLLHSASCPLPLPGSLWGEVWMEKEAPVSERGRLPLQLYQQKQQTYLLQSERGSHRTAAEGRKGVAVELRVTLPLTSH